MPFDSTPIPQGPRQHKVCEAKPTVSAAPSPIGRAFGGDKAAAELLGVGEKTLAELMRQPWFPAPINLGPRLRRHDLIALAEAVRLHAPRISRAPEPAHLAATRRAKRAATATAEAGA